VANGAQDGLDFTFDTKFFEAGINKVVKGFGQMETTAGKVAKGINKGLTTVAAKAGVVFAGFKSIRSALLDMPEVGQAFGIAKDIFTKNLLFPLRKEIFPLLQNMLTWVRDSRSRFVKWGQVVANVFRGVVSGVKDVISFIKEMSTSIGRFAQDIFGTQIRGVEDLFNIISFKVAVVAQFASILIEDVIGLFGRFTEGFGDVSGPLRNILDNLGKLAGVFTGVNEEGNSFKAVLGTISETLGKSARFVIEMTDSFLEGFIPAISQAATPLQGIFDALGRIQELIFSSTDSMNTWKTIFESLGSFLGGVFMVTLKAIETIFLGIEKVIQGIQEIREEGLIGALRGSVESGRESGVSGYERTFGKRVNDAVLRPDGSVIETDPKDTLIAAKDLSTSLGGLIGGTTNNRETTANFNIDFSGMTLQVADGSRESAEELSVNLVDMMRQELNRDFERFALG